MLGWRICGRTKILFVGIIEENFDLLESDNETAYDKAQSIQGDNYLLHGIRS